MGSWRSAIERLALEYANLRRVHDEKRRQATEPAELPHQAVGPSARMMRSGLPGRRSDRRR
jgi:hypothetical protein